jgi:two-component system sensor histidine kinase RegB
LLNLLNNAVDASALRDSNHVTLEVRRDGSWLDWIVRDRGPGFGATRSALGESGKQSGLGIGLALAEATAERLSGELIATNTENGAEMCLRLPLSTIAEGM